MLLPYSSSSAGRGIILGGIYLDNTSAAVLLPHDDSYFSLFYLRTALARRIVLYDF